MTQELAKQFNAEVEGHRRALLYLASKREWEAFKARAGRLFEYLEKVEATERERRFYTIFYFILVVLTLAVIVALGVEPRVSADWLDQRRSLILAALAGCSFELFFYLNFRWYAEARMAGFLRRRAAFIRGIEQDFRTFEHNPGEHST